MNGWPPKPGLTVHDVQVQPPGASPHRPTGFRGKLAEVRGQERRRNDHAARLKVWRVESNLSVTREGPVREQAPAHAVAGAAAPRPGSSLGGSGLGTSGRSVAACAPEG